MKSVTSVTSDGSSVSVKSKQSLKFPNLKSESVRIEPGSAKRLKIRGSIKTFHKKVPFNKVKSFQYRRRPSISRTPRFSITEPIADVDYFQSMLMPNYKNATNDDEGGQVTYL